ncbi:MAG: hypothetical protein RJA36_797 [Pseudomonadota bacterium]|jgi:crossover junction endodeoxyribonuclease RusA
MVRVVLPWPSNALSPNARHGHWAQQRSAQKRYRDTCYLSVLEQRVRLPRGVDRFDVLLQFLPPDARRYDRDNLVARMKAGLDGVARAWDIDDVRFVRVAGELVEVRDASTPCVLVHVTPHAATNMAAGTSPVAPTE